MLYDECELIHQIESYTLLCLVLWGWECFFMLLHLCKFSEVPEPCLQNYFQSVTKYRYVCVFGILMETTDIMLSDVCGFSYINTTSICLFFSCIFLIKGSSSGIQTDEVCYGRRWQFPSNYIPSRYTGPIYFTETNTGSKKVVINNGMVSSLYVTITFRQYDKC